MRIISGSEKGRKLKAPKDDSTRPTEDRIKENVFNLLQGPFYDTRVLDLFSGTGGIGLEFLSRGAQEVWFNDISIQSKKLIIENVTNSNFSNQARIFSQDYKVVLEKAKKEMVKFDYIYLDPPYNTLDYYLDSMKQIFEFDLLSEDGRLIVEGPFEYEMDPGKLFQLQKYKKYRTTGIWIYIM